MNALEVLVDVRIVAGKQGQVGRSQEVLACVNDGGRQSDGSGDGGGDARVWDEIALDIKTIVASIVASLASRFTETPPTFSRRESETECSQAQNYSV
jgi:hypothetical protein